MGFHRHRKFCLTALAYRMESLRGPWSAALLWGRPSQWPGDDCQAGWTGSDCGGRMGFRYIPGPICTQRVMDSEVKRRWRLRRGRWSGWDHGGPWGEGLRRNVKSQRFPNSIVAGTVGSLGAEVRQRGWKETPNLAVSSGVIGFVFSGPAKMPVQKGPLVLQFQSPQHLSPPCLSVAKSRERPGWVLALKGFLVCLLSSPHPRPQPPFLTPIDSFPPSLPR